MRLPLCLLLGHKLCISKFCISARVSHYTPFVRLALRIRARIERQSTHLYV